MTKIVNAKILLQLPQIEGMDLTSEQKSRVERLMSVERRATVYINYKMESVSIEFPDEELHIF